MSGIGTGYDLGVNTYSPDGKLFQTEYAQKAVDSSGTAIGLRCKDGVVLGVEKTVLSKLLVEGTCKRIFHVDRHAGMAIAGMLPDGREVVNRSTSDAAQYKQFYGESIPGSVLTDRLASYLHVYNLYGALRPFGSAALIATHDVAAGHSLFLVEPSGEANKYFGTAVGKARQAAKTEIEKLKLQDMTCREGVHALARIIHYVREEEKPFEIEMSWVCEESGNLHQRVPADLASAADVAAKASLDDSDMDDD